MISSWPVSVLFSALALAGAFTASNPAAHAQATRAVDESFFAEKVYPMLHAVQCERCHSDNGVASEARLEFPESDGSRDQITTFGLSLIDLVDGADARAARRARIIRTRRMRKVSEILEWSGRQVPA